MQDINIAIIGLFYVDLPIARLFSAKDETNGFVMNQARVDALMGCLDATLDLSYILFQSACKNGFKCNTDLDEIKKFNFNVDTLSTSVDYINRPYLRHLWSVCETVFKVNSKNKIAVFESTRFLSVTKEEYLTVVDMLLGLKFNLDFFALYSPERINPGNKEHIVEKMKNVTFGSTPEIAEIVEGVNNSVLVKETYNAPLKKVVKSSNIIENIQCDIKIVNISELAKMFYAKGIDNHDFIEATSTEWSFIKLSSGLVGGHCFSVFTNYLIQYVQVCGVFRLGIFDVSRLNYSLVANITEYSIKCMNKKCMIVIDAMTLILDITFINIYPDIINKKIVVIYHMLAKCTKNITNYEPRADVEMVKHEYGIVVVYVLPLDKSYTTTLFIIANKQYLGLNTEDMVHEGCVFYDVTGILSEDIIDGRL